MQDCELYKFMLSGNLDKGPNVKHSSNPSLRWDHGNIEQYYYTTGAMLYPIYESVKVMCNNLSEMDSYSNVCFNIKDNVDHVYNQITDALNYAAQMYIPVIAPKVLKCWWSSKLSDIKQQAMISHRAWADAGKPRYGPIYKHRTKIKLQYKLEIKRSKNETQNKISEKLHSSLINKQPVQFWKTWKSKISNCGKRSVRLQGNPTNKEAAQAFAEHFMNACTPNNSHFNDVKKVNFLTNYHHT